MKLQLTIFFYILAANSVKAGKDNHLKAPFMPGPSEKDPVIPLTPKFRSDIRHEERQKFDQFRKQKEAEHQAYKLQVDVPYAHLSLQFFLLL